MSKRIEIKDDIVQDWIEGQQIVASHWSETEENLRVICRSEQGNKYQLIRFFRLDGQVVGSVDIQEKPTDSFMQKVLDVFCRF